MKKIKLGEVAEIITGPFGSQIHAEDYVPNGVIYVMPKDIGNRYIIESTAAQISFEDAERLKRYKLLLGDIVYSRRGDIEKCALVRSENVGSLCGTGCLRVRPNQKVISAEFLSFYLGQPHIKKWIISKSVGATMHNLNSEILKQLPLNLPPLETQKQIAAVLSALDDKISLNKKINSSLEEMAKTIYLHKFFRKPTNAKISDILIENKKSDVSVGDAKESCGDFPFFTSGENILR